MKSLKLFFVVFLLCLFTLASYAQPPKTVTCQTINWESLYLPCLEEGISGSVEMCITVWNSKVQQKLKGSVEGETSGATYTVSGVSNWMVKPMMNGNAENETQVTTMTVCLDGIPVLTIHMNYHYTYNANGELVAQIDNFFWECN